ncbi:MAG: transglycosylase SLT domain-containing protein [Rikenellaceae bacterium]
MFNTKFLFTLTLLNLLTLTSNSVLSTSLETKDITSLEKKWLTTTVEISPYDHLFRSISEKEGNDWRLLCAMAYHESRFRTDVVSHCGARGIMQVMPRVAQQFDVTPEQLDNVESNIYVANQVMTLIEKMLKLPSTTSEEDRLKMTIAAYNCGVGRIFDARRLANSFGEDSQSWEVISQYLVKMNDPDYYQHEVVQHGRFKGAGQTVAYVRNVMGHYEDYCLLAMR